MIILNISKDITDPVYLASAHIATMDFWEDLMDLFEKHGVAIVPQHNHEISFHEPMRIVPFDGEIRNALEKSTVCLKT